MKKYPKLFKDQPLITPKVLAYLERCGFIVPATTLHTGKRRTTEVTNPSAGEVVGYAKLADKLAYGEISQASCRLLLAVEATRKGGPRVTHTARLLVNSFVDDKTTVIGKVESWAKNHK